MIVENQDFLLKSNKEQSFKSVKMQGLEATLLGAGGNTEVIHHRLEMGKSFAINPEINEEHMELFSLVKGKMKFKSDKDELDIHPGFTISSTPMREYLLFTALTDCEFIYVSSQPVFYYYSKSIEDIRSLAIEVEKMDGYTSDHCTRIRDLSVEIGKELGLNSNQLVDLVNGSFFHDVGKIKIPLQILCKPGKLTEDEWEEMKKHAFYGAELLRSTGNKVLESASLIVEQHHERYDGTGYPYGLKKDEIKIEAMIVAVVDSFDAMTVDRVYRKGISKESALEEIKRYKGTQYHPEVVEAFLRVISRSSIQEKEQV